MEVDAAEERRRKAAIELRNNTKKRNTLNERIAELERNSSVLTLVLAEARWQVMWLDLNLGDIDWAQLLVRQDAFWGEVEQDPPILEALRAPVIDARGRVVSDSAGSPLNRAIQLREAIIPSSRLAEYRQRSGSVK